MSLPLTDIHELSAILGNLPPGDVPAAWWITLDEEALAAYDRFTRDHAAWRNRMDKLYRISGLPRRGRGQARMERIRISGLGDAYLVGLIPPSTMTVVPRFWRLNKQGVLVPRRYTVMEKNSEVNTLFAKCREIPAAVNYMPGMPRTLWFDHAAYPVHIRRPGLAVLAFIGHPPEGASPEFEPDARWERMKLSTFHLLRERQKAGDLHTPAGGGYPGGPAPGAGDLAAAAR